MVIGAKNVGAIVLAGGGSVRMGVPKHSLLAGHRTLLDVVVEAGISCDPVVLVGPPSVLTSLHLRDLSHTPRVVQTLEDPPDGGPSAGLAAALACLDTDPAWVQVLTCDLPRAAEVVAALARVEVPDEVEAVVAVDSQGWPQYLCGRFRAEALRRALSGDVRDRSVRRVLGGLVRHEVPLPDDLLADVDDPEAAARAGLRLP